MKTLSASLPSGLSPEPTPAVAGPAPAPGEQSAPGVCDFCRERFLRLQDRDGAWWHYRVSNVTPRGSLVGPCADPPAPPAKKHEAAQRSAEECLRRIREIAGEANVGRVLAEARRTFVGQSSQEKEDDDD